MPLYLQILVWQYKYHKFNALDLFLQSLNHQIIISLNNKFQYEKKLIFRLAAFFPDRWQRR